MAEFEEKLNGILSDPQAMKQIMSIAKALGEGGNPEPTAESTPPPAGAASPDSVSSLLPPLEDLDPRLVQAALRLFSEYYSTDGRKTALLSALLPFLKEERHAKVEKAVQITKLSRVVRVAFQLLKGGEEHV